MASSYKPRIPDAVWDLHKPTIERLYIGENKPLTAPGGVRDIMAREHDFHATKSQFEWRVKKIWKCGKYNKGRSSSQQGAVPRKVSRSISSSLVQLARRPLRNPLGNEDAQSMQLDSLQSRTGVSDTHLEKSTISQLRTGFSKQIAPSLPQADTAGPTTALAAFVPAPEQRHVFGFNGGKLSPIIGPYLNFRRPQYVPSSERITASVEPADASPMPQQDIVPAYLDMSDVFDFEPFEPEGMELVTLGLAQPDVPLSTISYAWANLPDLTTSIITIVEQLQPLLGTFAKSICILPDYITELSTPNQHYPGSMRMLSCKNVEVQLYHFILHRLINDPTAVELPNRPTTAVDKLFTLGLNFMLGPQILYLDKVIDSIPCHFTKALEQGLFCAALELGAARAVSVLIDRGIDPNKRYNFSGSYMYPLERTCMWRHYQATKVLLDHGADPNRFSHRHVFYHLYQSKLKDPATDILRLLVASGAELRAGDAEQVLHNCSSTECRILLEAFLDIVFPIQFRYLKLLDTVLKAGDYLDLLPILISKMRQHIPQQWSGPRCEDFVPLAAMIRRAAELGRGDITELLIDHGVVPDLGCFIMAARSKDMPTFQLFLRHGLDPNAEYQSNDNPTTTVLAICIAEDFVQAVDLLVEQGFLAQTLECRKSFEAALTATCTSGNVSILEQLLIAAHPQWLEDCGTMAITVATKAGHFTVVTALMSANVKPDDRSILTAIRCRVPELALTFKRAMTVDPSGDIFSRIIVEGILYGYPHLVKELIQDARSAVGVVVIDCNTDWGNTAKYFIRRITWTPRWHEAHMTCVWLTPLSAAILAGQWELVELLMPSLSQQRRSECRRITAIDREYSMSYIFITPLAASVCREDLTLLQRLLDQGADPKDDLALVVATERGNVSYLEKILAVYSLRYLTRHLVVGTRAFLDVMEAGPLSISNFPLGRVHPYRRIDRWLCPLGVAIRLHAESDGHSQMLSRMLPYVSDINLNVVETEWITETPLLFAIRFAGLQRVRLLVEIGGASVSLCPRLGCKRTPLQLAAELGDLQIAKYLLEHGAQTNEVIASSGGATALQLAAIGGFINMAVVLLDRGANVNAVSARFEGRTAFEGATEHGRIDMMTFLLENGADLLADEQKQFRRAVKFAQENAQYAAAEHAERLLGLAQSRSVGQWTGTQKLLQGI